MLDSNDLKMKLESIRGRDYIGLQSLIGYYNYNGKFTLNIHRVPKDPYAPPHTGIYRILVDTKKKHIINYNIYSKDQKIAISDFLARNFSIASRKISRTGRGTGFSGIISIHCPGQAIIQRSSVIIHDNSIEVRFFIGLPANGRKINSQIAQEMLFKELPEIVELSLYHENINYKGLKNHINVFEDSIFLRKKLVEIGLISFIANGAILPRKNSLSDKPMPKIESVLFSSPKSMEVEITLPHAGKVKGMGIPKGITLITGGGYHGKSTLMEAIEMGIYNHINGDGREQCVTNMSAVKVRAYSGRYITGTDISPFINNLPFGKKTTSFSSENASGSTSQAATIMEAIEVGADVLLMDEDTCATNFMVRDKKMKKLIKRNEEPITPFIELVRDLYHGKNISTIIVLGSLGKYFGVSDKIIRMKNFKPNDVTKQAHKISGKIPTKKISSDDGQNFNILDRYPISSSVIPFNKQKKFKINAKEIHQLNFGDQKIDLTDIEQLIELSQIKALGYALSYSKKYMDRKTTIKNLVYKVVNEDIKEKGLDIISNQISGDFGLFREIDLALVLNRLRGFIVDKNEEK